jgi:hypothetical protein
MPKIAGRRLLEAVALGAAMGSPVSAVELARAGVPAPGDAGRNAVVTVVAGIVSYTRWPVDATTIRLCTIGQGPGVAELLRAVDLGPVQRPVSVHALADATQAGQSCHAVYVGLAEPAATREVLRQVSGQPVLMLGEGAAFCSDGGMFCLELAAAQVKFNANLDAIARSGLRVSPLVLRIARGSAASGS